MGRSVAVVCPKGGVGKTTVAVNLGSALADKGFRCLIVGVDPQCGLTGSLGKDRFDIDYGLLDFYDPEGSPEKVIQESGIANLDFVTSNVWSREEEEELLAHAAAEPERLTWALSPFKQSYDFILMDCPPSLSALTYSALRAADLMLVPLQAEELAYRALPRLFDSLDELSRGGGRTPELLGIVLNQVDPRTRLANSVIARVRQEYGEQVFQTMIPRTVRLAEVAQRGRPVNLFNRVGAGSQAFAALAEEILTPMRNESERTVEVETEPVEQIAREESAEAAVAAASQPWKPGALLESVTASVESESGGAEPGEDERILSLEEAEKEREVVFSRSRPSLDDYDDNKEDEHLH